MSEIERFADMDPEPAIYFALDLRTQLVKIGCVRGSYFSNCPVTRVRQIATQFGHPLQLLGTLPLSNNQFDMDVERKLHLRFAATREDGEWFRLSEDMVKFIRTKLRGHICGICAGHTEEAWDARQREIGEHVGAAIRAKPEFKVAPTTESKPDPSPAPGHVEVKQPSLFTD